MTGSLYANDLAHIYQNHGMDAVEKQLDETLATPDYWMKALTDKNVSYGLFNNFSELLFCNKQEGDLTRISITDRHSLEVKYHLETLIGGAKGDKQVEGDLKTPLGVYLLKTKIDNPDPFYGPLALVTNYPNKFDLAQEKSGSGIWIHGHPINGSREAFTKGCLAINNSDLTVLSKAIDYHKTALIIAPDHFPKTDKQTIATILAELYQWRNHWKESLLEPYLSFYNKNFKRSNGESLARFSILKQSVFSQKVKRRINFRNINVLPYPNEDNRSLFYISFLEEYDAGSIHFNGSKELYIELIDNHISILTEN